MQLVFEACDAEGGSAIPSARKTFDGAGGVIGRGAGCDWVIADPSRLLSSHHGLVAYREGRYFLTDISSNGIAVAGSAERLRKGQAREISDGDEFRMGTLTIRARLIAPFGADSGSVVGPCESIPDDAFLALDPLDSFDREQRRETSSHELEALEEAVAEPEPWTGHSAVERDHLVVPRRAEPAPQSFSTQPACTAPPVDEAFWAQFAEALGIGVEALEASGREVLAIKVARLLRLGVEGLQQSVRTCDELKSELSLRRDESLLESRNPLKDCPDTHAALTAMLGPGELGQLSAERSLIQVHRELQVHQVALLAACRSALRTARSTFSPGHLLMCFDSQGKRPRFSTDGGHWRAYRRHYQRLIADQQGSDQLSCGDFAKAYEEQARLISTLHVDYSG
ncbi:type VI secretion system-associated FHA domain protein TagH [Pseudomonas sp. PWP3-1b2]|uniref:type VI secretion system-associated FHA domain protein TagH n=1 Tax=Pseudomonas sp. PWP3-1b2 TaxID=2804656 RepID=UPI003CF6AD03